VLTMLTAQLAVACLMHAPTSITAAMAATCSQAMTEISAHRREVHLAHHGREPQPHKINVRENTGVTSEEQQNCRSLLNTVSAVDREMRNLGAQEPVQVPEQLRALVLGLNGLRCDPRTIHQDLAALPTYHLGPFDNGPVIVYAFCYRSVFFSFGYDPAESSINLPAVYIDKSTSNGCAHD